MLLNASVLNAVVLNGEATVEDVLPHSGAPGGRYVSDAEIARILSGNYGVYPRVWVADFGGVMRDYSIRDNTDWGVAVEYGGDIDAPVGTATVKLWREHQPSLHSLAPLRSDSAYNVAGPAINAGRRIQIDVACPELGSLPTEDDYRIVFQGYVDSIDSGVNPIVLECRDIGAPLVDGWFPGPQLIIPAEAAPTQPLQTALQMVLDAGHLDNRMDVYVPVVPDPEVDVGDFKVGDPNGEPIMDAAQRVVQQIGWDFRARFADLYGEFRMTLKDPGRTKTEPDFTLWPYSIIDIKQLKIDRINVRNEIWVWYRPNNDTGTPRAAVLGTFPEPVFDSRTAGYGRRTMVIQEADDSPINTAELAQALADLITFDLAFPKADKQVEMPYCWFLELQDLIRFPGNGVTHDGDLDLAIVNYRHVIDQTQSRTTLLTRGSPAGSFFRWLSRRPSGPVSNPTGDFTSQYFSNLRQIPDYGTDQIRFTWEWTGPAFGDLPAGTKFMVEIQRGSDNAFDPRVDSHGSGADAYYDYTPGDDIEPFDDPSGTKPTTIQISYRVHVGAVIGVGFSSFFRSAVNTVTYRTV